MNFCALGGAQEIGASCYLIEIDGKSILLDCGLRYLHDPETARKALPDLDLLDRVDAVCVSHAHVDHVGALPVVMDRYRSAFCFMTVPTFPLSLAMLLNLVRRMEDDYELMHFHPLRSYSEESIERLADRVLTVKFRHTFHPFKNHPLTMTFLPAGHILGAAGVLIRGEEGSFFFTGDFTRRTQRTVRGADFNISDVDVLITETTYGGANDRDQEEVECEFAATIAETIARSGNVLIPTFSLGKAQETLLALAESQAAGRIPAVPIFVDGLVREICDYYEELIRAHLLFRESGVAPIIRVDDPETRKFVFAGGPAIVVSSSGQLVGGPSVGYARELLPDPKNAVIFVSFLDEESPGRLLGQLKTGGTVYLDDTVVDVRATVRYFQFRSHASGEDLVAVATSLNPRMVVGVHGDPPNAKAFADKLARTGFEGSIVLPENGYDVSCDTR